MAKNGGKQCIFLLASLKEIERVFKLLLRKRMGRIIFDGGIGVISRPFFVEMHMTRVYFSAQHGTEALRQDWLTLDDVSPEPFPSSLSIDLLRWTVQQGTPGPAGWPPGRHFPPRHC